MSNKISQVKHWISHKIKSIENSKTPLSLFIISAFFSTTLRNFLELFSNTNKVSSSYLPAPLLLYLHNYAFYTTILILIITILTISTKTNPKKLTKPVLLFFSTLQPLIPIIELIHTKGSGNKLAYLSPWQNSDLTLQFFTFFGNFSEKGVGIGQRIAIAASLVGVYFYTHLKKTKTLNSLAATFLTYLVFFFLESFPFTLNFIYRLFNQNLLSFIFPHSNTIFLKSYLILIFFSSLILLWLNHKKTFLAIIKDIRPLRLTHFLLMFLLGITINSQPRITVFQNQNLFDVILIPLSISFAWLHCVFINNIFDLEIDRVANKKRPLITKTITTKTYNYLTWIFFALALILSATINYIFCFTILVFIANYFLYSSPPTRFKKIPFISKIPIALNTFILFLSGFWYSNGNLQNIPWQTFILIFINLTLALNFIDIKDYQGDKKANIKTLPVLFGLRLSKYIISFFFITTYLIISQTLQNHLIILISIFSSLAILCFINQKKYQEWPIFVIYLTNLFFLIIYLSHNPLP